YVLDNGVDQIWGIRHLRGGRSGHTFRSSRAAAAPRSGDEKRRDEQMESASIAVPGGGSAASGGDKGLKRNAIGYLSNVVIAVASVAPAYSLAATLGFIVAVPSVGLSAPAVL